MLHWAERRCTLGTMSGREVVDLNKWIESFSTFMAEEALKVLRKKTDDKGIHAYTALTLSFVSQILGNLVLDTLQDRPEHLAARSPEMVEYSLESFSNLKMATQDAIGLAFTLAAQHYAKKADLNYYCEIKLEPKMVSKELN